MPWYKHLFLLEGPPTKGRSKLRYFAQAILGVYLLLSPWILKPATDTVGTVNAWTVGACLLATAVLALAAREIGVALGCWLVAAPYALGFSDSMVASVNAWVVGVLTAALAGAPETVAALDTLLRRRSLRYGALRLSPQKVAGCDGAEEAPEGPGELARRIVERSEQIHRKLVRNPTEVELEMCILGYRSCTVDMLLLLSMLEGESAGAGPIRRLRLGRTRRKTIRSLSQARKVIPTEALCILDQRPEGDVR